MMSRYWQITGADGRRYCWSKTPTMQCVVAVGIELAEGVPNIEWSTAAGMLGMDAAALMQLVKARSHGDRVRVNGKLTNRCEVCGGHVELKGYRCWIEAAQEPSDSAVRMALRLGGVPTVWRQVEGPWFQPSRQAAQDWARSRVAETKKATV